MQPNLRNNSLSRYAPVGMSPNHHHSTLTGVWQTEKTWMTHHVVLLGVLVLLGLGAALSGIYWQAVRLAAYAPQVSATSRPPEVINIPATVALAQPEPTPPPTVPVADEGLMQIINSWAANHPSINWSIAVNGLAGDGRFASYNADKKRGLASVYKVFLMYPLLQKVPLEQFGSTYVTTESGGTHTVGECVDAMLRFSDNECGVAIGRFVGWSSADRTLNELGFPQTELYSNYGTQSSAGDTAKLLGELWGGQMFSDAERQYIIDILKVQTKRSGIPAGCSGCSVANKTGSLEYVNNDAGLVYYADKNYALVVFTDGAGFDKIAQLTEQVNSYMSN